MEVLSSGSSQNCRNVMSINNICGRDAGELTSHIHQPRVDSPNIPETSASTERKRKFAAVEPGQPRPYIFINADATTMNARYGPSDSQGSSSPIRRTGIWVNDRGVGLYGEIPDDPEIMKRVEDIVGGVVEPVPGEPFEPYPGDPRKSEEKIESFKNECIRRISEYSKAVMLSDSTLILRRIRNHKYRLSSYDKTTTTLWNYHKGEMVPRHSVKPFIGNNTIVGMTYQEIGKNEVLSKFLLIPGVPGYDCRYYTEHLKRKYAFLKPFVLALDGNPSQAISTFLTRMKYTRM
ncbi:hypothetical protein IWQ62_002772 [Dispira parvispora]|uniref:Uncharacterized protein n=1 Tax=Dispira parvispora TaxID=1520584 RepID=A0A9W8AV42_9FUNG|nr:hypothetical protein IWQ62_002772 [Dispira parvispora]